MSVWWSAIERFLIRRPVGRHPIAEWVALARFLAARRAHRLLAGELLSRAAARYVDDLYGTTGSTPEVRSRIIETTQIDAARVTEFAFPQSWPPFFRRSMAFEARVRHRLHDVVVSPLSGLAWTPPGQVIGDSIGSVHRLLGWGNVAHEMLLPIARESLDGRVVCTISRNYGHWLFESLPHILGALSAYPDATVLLPASPKDRPSFVEESLRLALGDEAFQASVLYASQPHRVNELLLTSMPVDPYFIHPAVIPLLRSTFASHLATGRPWRRLYVSRRSTPKRRMDNEAAIEALMSANGFEILRSEEVAFAERIRLFSEAHTVVGPHGAGLSSILWCRPGTYVIELLPPSNFNDYFARLALMNSLVYEYIQARSGAQPGGRVVLAELERAVALPDGAPAQATVTTLGD